MDIYVNNNKKIKKLKTKKLKLNGGYIWENK